MPYTNYAAIYYPWLKIKDPSTGEILTIPPGGHVAGIYVRNDTEQGVFKAPTNEVVHGAVELELPITKREQDFLNTEGINIIRSFPGRGIRVWGARTMSNDPSWKFVNVCRLFLFLEESIDKGIQWVIFEHNDEKLWIQVKETITQFLTYIWHEGALMGKRPEEAFFVKCDRSTMTPNDIKNSKLVVMIGIAHVKPAEFMIFRISQRTSNVSLE